MHDRKTARVRRGLRALCSAGAIGAALCVFRPAAAFASALPAPPPAGTAIPNVAQGSGTFTGVPLVVDSNPVVTIVQALPVPAPRVRYFGTPAYAQEIHVGRSGQPLYVQVDAPGWDRDPALPDTAQVTLVTARTSDRETFLAVETGASTGVFRIAPDVATTTVPPPARNAPAAAVSGDHVVSATRGDVVTATAVPATLAGTSGAASAEATLWMDPGALAFDAATDRAEAGVVVALVDVTGQGNGGAPGGPARVFARRRRERGARERSSPTRTARSCSRSCRAARTASTWRRARGAAFRPTLPPAALPAGHVVDVAGSYGGAFAVSDSLAPVTVDLPLDAGGAALFVEKTASSPVRRARRGGRLRGARRQPRRGRARLGRRARSAARGLCLRPRHGAARRRARGRSGGRRRARPHVRGRHARAGHARGGALPRARRRGRARRRRRESRVGGARRDGLERGQRARRAHAAASLPRRRPCSAPCSSTSTTTAASARATSGCRACACSSTTARSRSPTRTGATACTGSRRARTRSRSTRSRCPSGAHADLHRRARRRTRGARVRRRHARRLRVARTGR